MNSVPMRMPAAMAITDHHSDPPSVMLMSPTARVAICAFDMNHSGPRCHNLPCLSSIGTQSMERVSRPLMRLSCDVVNAPLCPAAAASGMGGARSVRGEDREKLVGDVRGGDAGD